METTVGKKRPIARITIDWDPDTGKIGYSQTGLMPMEELGLLALAEDIRMGQIRNPDAGKRIIESAPPIPHLRQ